MSLQLLHTFIENFEVLFSDFSRSEMVLGFWKVNFAEQYPVKSRAFILRMS